MKIIAFVLLLLLFWLQYKIWLQDGGIPEVLQLQDEITAVKEEVSHLQGRNASLDAEVRDLKKGLKAIEERARSEMGMIKQGEVYFQVIDSADKDTDKQNSNNKNSGEVDTNPVTADDHSSSTPN